ncbi:hypothetical protein JTE90_024978 [Oedothorax gibbosus]|uniref:Cytochrome P450 n=1 Tax=Oedothorax gibbosus TaxID=931172 RepID=A0AAV6VVS3_9ARAC|nr:hypothetical protein JTE90_024978 [Oedothorax gibbosus]
MMSYMVFCASRGSRSNFSFQSISQLIAQFASIHTVKKKQKREREEHPKAKLLYLPPLFPPPPPTPHDRFSSDISAIPIASPHSDLFLPAEREHMYSPVGTHSLRLTRRLVGMAAPSARGRSAAACPFTAAAADDHSIPAAMATPSAVRPYESIPCEKGLPIIGTTLDLMRQGGAAKIHEYCDRRHKQFGPIFKEQLGAMDVVVVSSDEFIRKVYCAEGKFPVHLVPEAWEIYNKKKGITRGLFFMNGQHWRDTRVRLNRMFMPRESRSFGGAFNKIVTDLHERWEKLSESDGLVPDLENELYNWSIETLGQMVFGRRLGCVMPAEYESQMHEFVYQVQQIFKESATMAIVPPTLASSLRLPVWRRFERAADRALEMARSYVIEGIEEINELAKNGVKSPGILRDLMAVKEMDLDEKIQIVADLILAAADTTSHATQWALHCLAKHPECQEKLYAAINDVVPPGQEITEENLKNIPYVQMVIKETLRLYPIASFLTRILPQKIVLGDYEIPAGKLFFMSQYTVGRDPNKFPEPEKFLPERWRKSKVETGCIPFGFGSRACVGRKVAELKMELMLARTVQQFHMESANETEVGIQLRMITTPDQPIKLRLRKRST